MTDFARRLAADTYQQMLESIAPNAARLKRASNSHLGRALLLAVNVHLLIIGLFWATAFATASAPVEPPPPFTGRLVERVVRTPPPIETPPEARSGGAAVSPDNVGTPVPAPDATVDEDATVASNDDLPLAGVGPVGDTPSAGDGTGTTSVPKPRRASVPLPGGPSSAPPVVSGAPSVTETPQPDANEPFEFVEVEPALVGGLDGLQQGIEYPDFERSAGIAGQVIVRFVVNEDGRTTEVEVVRSASPGLDRAAVQAVQRARFTPGQQNGRTVRVRMTLPVTFRLR